jgi:uncharacterized cupin superfamily protein
MTTDPKPPAFDPATVEPVVGNPYPEPFREVGAARIKRRLGDHGGLTNFGVNHVTLPPGCASALRHWHQRQDEFVMVLTGALTLETNAGRQTLVPGMCATFPAGHADGHRLLNLTDAEATYLEVGDRTEGDETDYPDIDMELRHVDGGRRFVRRSDGTPY